MRLPHPSALLVILVAALLIAGSAPASALCVRLPLLDLVCVPVGGTAAAADFAEGDG